MERAVGELVEVECSTGTIDWRSREFCRAHWSSHASRAPFESLALGRVKTRPSASPINRVARAQRFRVSVDRESVMTAVAEEPRGDWRPCCYPTHQPKSQYFISGINGRELKISCACGGDLEFRSYKLVHLPISTPYSGCKFPLWSVID